MTVETEIWDCLKLCGIVECQTSGRCVIAQKRRLERAAQGGDDAR